MRVVSTLRFVFVLRACFLVSEAAKNHSVGAAINSWREGRKKKTGVPGMIWDGTGGAGGWSGSGLLNMPRQDKPRLNKLNKFEQKTETKKSTMNLDTVETHNSVG